MGLAKKMEWFKWIRKYSTGILDTKTGSMETLIDSASSKTINYAYTSSVIADDEFVNAGVLPPPSQPQQSPHHQRPMLPPPTLQDSPSQPPNDVYDCCVSLDGIPIKHEFQYTLSDTDGCGKITKHDIEGLASKILESMYGTTAKFSSRGQRTVKVTLNVRQSAAADGTPSWIHLQQHQQQLGGRERKNRNNGAAVTVLSVDRGQRDSRTAANEEYYEPVLTAPPSCPEMYGTSIKVSSSPPLPHLQRVKPGAQRYRRDQLVEMVQRSLAENLSFQNQRKSNKPEGYHRPRTKRRQSSAGALQTTGTVPSVAKPKTPAKVAWSPYDFEPVAYVPSHHHHQQQQQHIKTARVCQQQQPLYGGVARATVDEHAIKPSTGGRQQKVRVAVVAGDQQTPKNKDAQEQTKNIDHQRYKRAKLASKKIHHHIHEHHHYHHYDYYIV